MKLISPLDASGYNEGTRKQLLIWISLVIFILIASSAALNTYLNRNYDKDNEMKADTIYVGKGVKEIQIGDPIENIIKEYGDPERRVDTENAIWLIYRNDRGVDILLSNVTKKVIEIRFNEGFQGEMEGGISIGDNLDEIYHSISNPKVIIDENLSDSQSYIAGSDRVLYRRIDENGDIALYKYIDSERGVLFWADGNKVIIQIVVFNPY